MQKIIIIVLSAALLMSATVYFQSERTATVPQKEGLYLFWECKPVDHYEVIGTVKHSGIVMSNSFEYVKGQFVKKAKQAYPKAHGIYYDPDITGEYAAFVIMFK